MNLVLALEIHPALKGQRFVFPEGSGLGKWEMLRNGVWKAHIFGSKETWIPVPALQVFPGYVPQANYCPSWSLSFLIWKNGAHKPTPQDCFKDWDTRQVPGKHEQREYDSRYGSLLMS